MIVFPLPGTQSVASFFVLFFFNMFLLASLGIGRTILHQPELPPSNRVWNLEKHISFLKTIQIRGEIKLLK